MARVATTTLVIPSVFRDQLIWFLEKNANYIKTIPVIVVSSDPTVTLEILNNYVANATLIALEKPLGFAKTVNLGLRQTTTEWVATCNDDVLLSAGWLERLLAGVDEKTGGINPVIVGQDDMIESAGIALLPVGKAVPLRTTATSQPFQTQALNAACVVYRQSAIEAVGLFDEWFGSYLEDIDLSLSLLAAGWELIVVPEVKVTHVGHQTTQRMLGWKKAWYDARNWWLILFKHWSWQLWLAHLPGILLERARNTSGMIKALMGS